jgi:hypothetical protein
VIGLAALMTACGGGSSNQTLQLRIVMASPDTPPVDIKIDGAQVATSLAYENSMPYQPLNSGQRRIEVVTVNNSTAVFQQTITVSSTANQTLLLTGPESKMEGVLLTDGNTGGTSTTSTTVGHVRIVNASQSMGAADVYLVNAGTPITAGARVAKGLAFDKATSYQDAAAGNYQIFMTVPGTTSTLLDTNSVALTANQYQTVLALDQPGGGFTYLVLTDQ